MNEKRIGSCIGKHSKSLALRDMTRRLTAANAHTHTYILTH